MARKSVLILVAITALTSFGCSKKDTGQMRFSEREVLKVSAFKSGETEANGKVVSLQELDRLLEANAKKNGVVWYYREAGMEEPPQQAMEAMALIIKHQRPVSMSSKPDFSDTIDTNGNSVPRPR